MEKDRQMNIGGFDVEAGHMYFSTHDMNGIFHMDMTDGKVRYVTMSEKYKAGDMALYQNAIVDNEKVWFAPYSADHILIYDSVSAGCEYIPLPELKGHGRDSVKCYGIYDDEKWMILIPAEYPAIVRVHKETYKTDVIQWEEKLLKTYPDFLKGEMYLAAAWDFEVVGETMYLLAGNVVMKYNMKTNALSYTRPGGEERNLCGIARFGEKFILVDRMNGACMLWDEAHGRIETMSADMGYRGLKAKDDGCPLGVYQVRDGIVIIQAKADFLLHIDQSGQFRRRNLLIDKKRSDDYLFSHVRRKGNQFFFPLNRQNSILCVDTDDWSQKIVKMDLSELDLAPVREKMDTEEFISENATCYRLSDFLQKTVEGQGREQEAGNRELDIKGEQIFSECRRLC